MPLLLRAVCYLSLIVSLIASPQAFAILNGKPVAEGSKFSKQVAQLEIDEKVVVSDTRATGGFLETEFKNGEHCSSTFISRDLVLTAAHCVTGHPFNEIKVTIGWRPRIFRTTAKRVVFNPEFGGSQTTDVSTAHDIAMIQTSDLLPEDFFVTPVAFTAFLPAHAAMVGFGSTPNPIGGSWHDYQLTYALAKKADDFSVFNVITIEPLSQGFLTYGDSGGPLLGETPNGLVQYGVASAKVHNVKIGEYSSTYVNREWIFASLKNLRHENATLWRSL